MNNNIYKSKKFIFMTIIASLLLILAIIYNWDSLVNFILLFKNSEDLRAYLQSFGYLSGLIFFLFQIMQVVIFFIPGEVFQAAGGYVFGAYLGTLISFLGIGVGSFILFSICQKLGKSFVSKHVPNDIHQKFDAILNNKNRNLIILILYLLPGMPKDCLIMICALTNITAKEFMFYSMIGRIPALFLSTYIGSNIASGNNVKAIIISVICITCSILVVIYKEKLLSLFSKKKKRIN